MKLEDVKVNDLSLSHVIRLIRELFFLFVLSYLTLHLFSGELRLDFTKLSASELVSMLLAFFSISLSAAFYFAATNSSNQFYDNINKFNKDTSELLGRLDEQIKSVNTRQDELRDSFDRHYGKSSRQDLREIKQKTDAKLKDAEEDWGKFLQNLIDSIQIDPSEKRELEVKLREKDEELAELREQSLQLKARTQNNVRGFIRRRIRKMGLEKAVSMDPNELLYRIAEEGPFVFRRDLETLGFIESKHLPSFESVTSEGEKFITKIIERLIDSEEDS